MPQNIHHRELAGCAAGQHAVNHTSGPHVSVGRESEWLRERPSWHKLDPLLVVLFRGRQPGQFGTFLTPKRSFSTCAQV